MKKSLLNSCACALLLLTQGGYCMDDQSNPQSQGDTPQQQRTETLQKPFNELSPKKEKKVKAEEKTTDTPSPSISTANSVLSVSDIPASPEIVPSLEENKTKSSHALSLLISQPVSPFKIGAAIQLIETLNYAFSSSSSKEINELQAIPAPSSSISSDSSTVSPKIDLMVTIPQPFTQFNPRLQKLLNLTNEEKSFRNDILSFIDLSDFWHNYLSCSLKITTTDPKDASSQTHFYSKKCDYNLKPTLRPCKEGMCFSDAFYELFSNELSIWKTPQKEELFPICLFIDREEYWTDLKNIQTTPILLAAMNANKLFLHLEFLYVLAQQIQDCKNLVQKICNPSELQSQTDHSNTSYLNQLEILLYNKMKNLEVFVDFINHYAEETELGNYLIIRPNRSQTEITAIKDLKDRFIFASSEFLKIKCNKKELSLAELRVGPLPTDQKAIDKFGLFSEPLFLLLPNNLCTPDKIDQLFIRLHYVFYALEFKRRLGKYISINYLTLKSDPIFEKHAEIKIIRENKLPTLLFQNFRELITSTKISLKTKKLILNYYKQLKTHEPVVLKLSPHPTEEIIQKNTDTLIELLSNQQLSSSPRKSSPLSALTTPPRLFPQKQNVKKKQTTKPKATTPKATSVTPNSQTSPKTQNTVTQLQTLTCSSAPLSPPLISNSTLEQLTTFTQKPTDPQDFEDLRRILDSDELSSSESHATESEHFPSSSIVEPTEEEKQQKESKNESTEKHPMSSDISPELTSNTFIFPAPNVEVNIIDSMLEYLEKFIESNQTKENSSKSIIWAQSSICDIKKLKADQEKIEPLQSTIEKLRSQTRNTQAENEKLKKENQKQKQTIKELQENNKDLQTQLNTARLDKEKQLSQLHKKLKKTSEEVQKKLKYAKSAEEISANLQAELSLAQATIEQVIQDKISFTTQIAALKDQLTKIQKQNEENLTRQRETTKKEIDSIEFTSRTRFKLIHSLEQEISEQKLQIQKLETENKEQKLQIQKLEAAKKEKDLYIKELQAQNIQTQQDLETQLNLVRSSNQSLKQVKQQLDKQKKQNLELEEQLKQIQQQMQSISTTWAQTSTYSEYLSYQPFNSYQTQHKEENYNSYPLIGTQFTHPSTMPPSINQAGPIHYPLVPPHTQTSTPYSLFGSRPFTYFFKATVPVFVPKSRENQTGSTIISSQPHQRSISSTNHLASSHNFFPKHLQQHQSSALTNPIAPMIPSPENTPTPNPLLRTPPSNTSLDTPRVNSTLSYLPPLSQFSTSTNSTLGLEQTASITKSVNISPSISTPPDLTCDFNLFNSSLNLRSELPLPTIIPPINSSANNLTKIVTDTSSTRSESEDTASVSTTSNQSIFSSISSFTSGYSNSTHPQALKITTDKIGNIPSVDPLKLSSESIDEQDNHYDHSRSLSSSTNSLAKRNTSRSISLAPTHHSQNSTKTMQSTSPSLTSISRSYSKSSISSYASISSSLNTISDDSCTHHSAPSPSTSSRRSLSVPPSRHLISDNLALQNSRSSSVEVALSSTHSALKSTPLSPKKQDDTVEEFKKSE